MNLVRCISISERSTRPGAVRGLRFSICSVYTSSREGQPPGQGRWGSPAGAGWGRWGGGSLPRSSVTGAWASPRGLSCLFPGAAHHGVTVWSSGVAWGGPSGQCYFTVENFQWGQKPCERVVSRTWRPRPGLSRTAPSRRAAPHAPPTAPARAPWRTPPPAPSPSPVTILAGSSRCSQNERRVSHVTT